MFFTLQPGCCKLKEICTAVDSCQGTRAIPGRKPGTAGGLWQKSRFPLLPKEQILASKRSSEAGQGARTPPPRRRGHEGNGSHRFEAGGSVRIGAGTGFRSLGTVDPVKRNGIEPCPGRHPCRAGSFRHEFRQRNPTSRDSTHFDSPRHTLRAAGSREPASRWRSTAPAKIGKYDNGVDRRKFRAVPGRHGQEEKGQGKR